MGGARLLVDDERAERLPRAFLTLRRAAALLAIVVATLAGGYLALVSFRQDEELSVGTIRLSVSPGHTGALDVYVPLVDWGARFEAIRVPARLRVDLRTVDRDVVRKVANGDQVDVDEVRTEARDAIAGFLRNLILTVLLCGGSLGVLTGFAVRGGATPQLRYTTGAAVATAALTAVALIVLLPPRGEISNPQYYAFGPDIARALEAVEAAQRGTERLDQALNAQLVGLARLVTAPANRPTVDDRPRLTLASDLHNTVVSIPILERTVAEGPVFFAGDMTDRGSPIEGSLVRRVVRTGEPFVFVPGNHDSDQRARELANDGAIVLTRNGRLNGRGETTGRPVVEVEGLRSLTRWTSSTSSRAPSRSSFVGHTHHGRLTRRPGATVLNAGTVGAGGTPNLLEREQVGVARLACETQPRFTPLAADLIEIDPRSGNATARRQRLDEPVSDGSR